MLSASALALGGCGLLPRSGPTRGEILSGSVERGGDAHIVPVTEAVVRATAYSTASVVPAAFLQARELGGDVIQPGDLLAITVWENVSTPLLGGGQGRVTSLDKLQVDSSGHIFLPYVGRIRAAGHTTEQLRVIITRKLDPQTPDPQVIVQRAPGDGATVTVVGNASGQGVFPIERASNRLSELIARAGGLEGEPETIRIRVSRAGHEAVIWAEDLMREPRYDIALRPGDRIVVERDPRAFLALGAAGTQTRVPFTTRSVSALEALAAIGGISERRADPTGIFVLRNEPEPIARRVLGRADVTGPQRVIYVLDLTKPNALFLAGDFQIRDGDVIYVTEAPIVSWNKGVSALLGTLGQARAVESSVSGL